MNKALLLGHLGKEKQRQHMKAQGHRLQTMTFHFDVINN